MRCDTMRCYVVCRQVRMGRVGPGRQPSVTLSPSREPSEFYPSSSAQPNGLGKQHCLLRESRSSEARTRSGETPSCFFSSCPCTYTWQTKITESRRVFALAEHTVSSCPLIQRRRLVPRRGMGGLWIGSRRVRTEFLPCHAFLQL